MRANAYHTAWFAGMPGWLVGVLAIAACLLFPADPARAETLHELQGLPYHEVQHQVGEYEGGLQRATRRMNLLAVERDAAMSLNRNLGEHYHARCQGHHDSQSPDCRLIVAQGRNVRVEFYLLTADILTSYRSFLLDHNHHLDHAVAMGIAHIEDEAMRRAQQAPDNKADAQHDLFDGQSLREAALEDASRARTRLADTLTGAYQAEGLDLGEGQDWIASLARTAYVNRLLMDELERLADGYRALAQGMRAPYGSRDPFELAIDLLAETPVAFGRREDTRLVVAPKDTSHLNTREDAKTRR